MSSSFLRLRFLGLSASISSSSLDSAMLTPPWLDSDSTSEFEESSVGASGLDSGSLNVRVGFSGAFTGPDCTRSAIVYEMDGMLTLEAKSEAKAGSCAFEAANSAMTISKLLI